MSEILGVKVSEVTKEQALQKVGEFLGGGQHKIFTPNPEMIVRAQKDEYFKEVLNSADLNLCDGMGVQIFTGIKRIPGVDFMVEICRLAERRGSSVYLLGSGIDGVVKKTVENLQIQFPNLKIVGFDKGPGIIGSDEKAFFEPVQDDDIRKINEVKPEILFVAFGMGKQEKWIYENLSKMPSVKVAMGVGGSFDFISGKIKRAPLFLRQIGLEWVYRLWQEPRRVGRIFNATFKFGYYIFRNLVF